MRNRKTGFGFLAGAVATMVLALAPAAQAGSLVRSLGGSCPAQPLSQPFLRWLDPASYTLVRGGSFEAGASGWTLSGAKVTSGNESFYVHGAGESKSLSLPSQSSATTPVECASLDRPTMRFFAKRSGGTVLSTLKVEVLFEAPLTGKVMSLPVGVVAGGSAWAPSLPMVVVANLSALLPGGQTPVAFRFTPVGAGTWTIDDVYLDPKRR